MKNSLLALAAYLESVMVVIVVAIVAATVSPVVLAQTPADSHSGLGAPPTADSQQLATPPSPIDPRIHDIINAVSANRIEQDIRTLAGFGTRHTLSDTVSHTRGIGAARRWLFDAFSAISQDCGGCLEITYQRSVVAGERRIPDSTDVVNVVEVQRGTIHPNRYVIMSGDIDSRISDGMNFTSDAPGANDNASGLAGTLEAARVLSNYEFGSTIVYAGLSGEEQGLFGGRHMAEVARQEGWEIAAVLNNDMIGNIEGLDGIIDNTIFACSQSRLPQRPRKRSCGGCATSGARWTDHHVSSHAMSRVSRNGMHEISTQ